MKNTVDFDYSIGDRVRIKAVDMIGTVSAMRVDSDNRSYQIIYWSNCVRNAVWMENWEITMDTKEAMK